MSQLPNHAIDDPLLARLDRLAQRRAASPPFAPPSGQRVDDQPAALSVPRTRRRHPARSARLGALAVSCAGTGALSYLFAISNGSDSQSSAIAGLPAPIAITAPATSPATGSGATTVAATAAQAAAFDGSVVNTRYGPVQVQAQITNGTLTEVAVIQYPDNDRKSLRINGGALPTLRTEALTAQSANVDTVSGATYTSDGYTQSLQSALDAARAAGITVAA